MHENDEEIINDVESSVVDKEKINEKENNEKKVKNKKSIVASISNSIKKFYCEKISPKIEEFMQSEFVIKLKIVLGNFFYEIGFFADYGIFKLKKLVKKIGAYLVKFVIKYSKIFLTPIFIVINYLWKTVSAPFYRIYRGAKNIIRVYKDEKDKGFFNAFKASFVYFLRGIKNHTHLLADLIMWLVAVGCSIYFYNVIINTVTQNFVLEVKVDDKIVGYIDDEEPFENAKEDILSQLVYTSESTDGNQWNIIPKYSLVTLDNNIISTSENIKSKILETSGQDIAEATGFYVDGVFYGATDKGEEFEKIIEDFKAPYITGAENTSVEFVKDVQLKKGVYLSNSIVSLDALNILLHSEEEGSVYYTIQPGEFLYTIAFDHDLTTNELYALNPQLQDNAVYQVGDKVLVKNERKFLQVKVLEHKVEDVVIEHDVDEIPNNGMKFNTRDVKTEGVDGLKTVTSNITYIDGVQTSVEIVSEVVITEPVTEVVEVGTNYLGQTVIPPTGEMMWPVPSSRRMSRGFSAWHNALDILSSHGAAIVASDSGVVVTAGWSNWGYGYHVVVDHGNGIRTLYAHLSSINVTYGQPVEKGALLGGMGSTGNSTGTHCHFEVQDHGIDRDPMLYVS